MGETPETLQGQELIVRQARAEDREAVLAFCAHTWGEYGDYIAHVWDAWLTGSRGAFLVAEVGSRPIGIVHVRMMSDDEAWIEGIRVDPQERRQGVGRALNSRALVAAHEIGATVARLFIDADNHASQGLVAHFGFTRVAEVVRYDAEALEDVETLAGVVEENDGESVAARQEELAEAMPQEMELTTPGENEFERIWAWLGQSNLAPFNGGLEFVQWTARALSEPSLREALAEGRVWMLEAWGTILALAVTDALPEPGVTLSNEPSVLRVRYLDGSSDGIGRLALTLREIAGEHGLQQVALWLPDLLILADAMDGAGYTRHDLMYVYARDL